MPKFGGKINTIGKNSQNIKCGLKTLNWLTKRARNIKSMKGETGTKHTKVGVEALNATLTETVHVPFFFLLTGTDRKSNLLMPSI